MACFFLWLNFLLKCTLVGFRRLLIKAELKREKKKTFRLRNHGNRVLPLRKAVGDERGWVIELYLEILGSRLQFTYNMIGYWKGGKKNEQK